MFAQKQSSKGVFQERCFANMKKKPEQKCRSAISTKPLCNFIKIIHTHRYAPENSQHILRTPSSERTPLGIASFDMFQRLKDLNYKEFLFTVVKRNY